MPEKTTVRVYVRLGADGTTAALTVDELDNGNAFEDSWDSSERYVEGCIDVDMMRPAPYADQPADAVVDLTGLPDSVPISAEASPQADAAAA